MTYRTSYKAPYAQFWREFLTGASGEKNRIVLECDWNSMPVLTSSTPATLFAWVIYKMNDEISENRPIYIKISLHHASAVKLVINVDIGLDYTLDGDVIGKIYSGSTDTTPTSTSDTHFQEIPRDFVASGQNESISFFHSKPSSSQVRFFIHIERARGDDGKALDSGDLVVLMGGGSTGESNYVYYTGGSRILGQIFLNKSGYSLGLVSGVRIFEPTLLQGSDGILIPPLKNVVYGSSADTPEGYNKINHLGANRRFVFPNVKNSVTITYTHSIGFSYEEE